MRTYCFVLITIFCGCTVLPDGLPGRTYIEKDSLEFVQTGQTSKIEVRQALGPPDWSFNGGSRWIYKTRRRGDYGLSGCVAFPDDGGEMRCSKSTVAPVMEFVDFSFDGQDVVDIQESLSIKSGNCNESNLCFHWTNSLLTVFASTDEDADAKQFQAEPGRCVVYLYSVDSFNAIDIFSDGIGAHGRYWSNDGFVRVNLDAGERTVTVTYSSLFGPFSRSLSLDCVAGDTYFMREQHDVNDNFSFNKLPDDEGRHEVIKRHLVLLPDIG